MPVLTPSPRIAPSFRNPLSTGRPFTLDSTLESLNFKLAVIVPAPSDTSVAIASADHGVTFVAALARENIVATQFHLEKSGAAGLRVLDNFCRMKF